MFEENFDGTLPVAPQRVWFPPPFGVAETCKDLERWGKDSRFFIQGHHQQVPTGDTCRETVGAVAAYPIR